MVSRIRSEIPKELLDLIPRFTSINKKEGASNISNFINNNETFTHDKNLTDDNVIYTYQKDIDIDGVSIQEQVVIGACATVGVFVLIAIVLRILMPIFRESRKNENDALERKESSEVLTRDSSGPYVTSSSSGTPSSRGSSSQLNSRDSSAQWEWSDSSSSNTKSTYFSHESKELLKAKLGSLASVSGSSLSLPNLSSSKTRLHTIIPNNKHNKKKYDNNVDVDHELTSGRGSMSSISNKSDESKKKRRTKKPKHEETVFYIRPQFENPKSNELEDFCKHLGKTGIIPSRINHAKKV